MSETIFALATAPAMSAIAIIRISGTKSHEILRVLTNNERLPPARTLHYTHLYDGDELLDQSMMVRFDAPNSYSGEDMAELHIHGGMANIKRIMGYLEHYDDCRLARAGEFSHRGVLNGKMDLTRAEGINDIIHAHTITQHQQAIQQAKGGLELRIAQLSDDIKKTLAHREAWIDFSDEELPDDLEQNMQQNINDIIKNMRDMLHQAKYSSRLRHGITVAIVGRANSGKSTLINYLAARDVAITSHIAGTTRDIIEVPLDYHDLPIIISDCAGVRHSDDVIEQQGVKRAIDHAQQADMRIFLSAIDDIDNHDIGIDKQAHDMNVINKIDLDDDITIAHHVAISLKDNINMQKFHDIFYQKLLGLCNQGRLTPLTRQRHIDAMNKALDNMLLAVSEYDIDYPELQAEYLRHALRDIGEISGYIDADSLLDVIFKDFCIGK